MGILRVDVRPLRARTAVALLLAAAASTTGCGGGSAVAADPAPGEPARVYASLGDSYASGLGAGRVYGPKCARTKSSYARVLSRELRTASFASAACAGATIADVLDAQLEVLGAGTKLVTVTIGGNDVGALRVVQECSRVGTAQCRQAGDEAAADLRTRVGPGAEAGFRAIRSAAPGARVLVTGYPLLFGDRGCSSTAGLDREERRYLNVLTEDLNKELARRARGAGATFVRIGRSFTGHELCTDDPWIGPSLHPNVDGQRLGYVPPLAGASVGAL